MFAERMSRARAAMEAQGIDVLLLSVGADLPYLTGYEAMPLERLTMLVVPRHGEINLVVPELEAPRVVERPGAPGSGQQALFNVVRWFETDDPLDLVAVLADGSGPGGGMPGVVALGDHTWSRFVLGLMERLPGARYVNASAVTAPLRAVKAADEVEALRRAAAAADRVAAQLQAGDIGLIGRTEAEVSADIGRRLVAEGHHRVNFAIVAAGENAASPHHEPAGRVIEPGEIVLCDFGGTMLTGDGTGYCSDITRCVHTGPVPPEVAGAYAVLREAQAAAVAAATVGARCEDVDAAARSIITAAGYGDRFIHRTGHGIGVEAHEDPYIVEGNGTELVAGHAFSVEPGIYVPGRWGMRLEDIVVTSPGGPDPLNRADHDLVVVDA